MKYKKLSEIAKIHSGLVLSRKEAGLDNDGTQCYKQINLRAISEDGNICINNLDMFVSNEIISTQFISKRKDILVRLFTPFYPLYITEKYENLLVPSQFAIIREIEHNFLQEFIYLYLSQKNIQNEISAVENNAIIRNIRISTIANIKIPVLPIEKQKHIVLLSDTHKNRKNLYKELLNQYDTQIDYILRKSIEGELQ